MSLSPTLQREVAGHFGRVKRRALTRALLRGVMIGLALSCAWIVLAATWIGPVASILDSGVIWLGAMGLLAGAAWWIAAPGETASVRHSAGLIDQATPGLGSRALTAFELLSNTTVNSGFSSTLAEAHAQQAVADLRELPVQRVVQLDWTRDRSMWAALAVNLVALSWLLVSPQLQLGLHALLHPSPTDGSGAQVGDVVERVTLRLKFPSYLRRAQETIEDAAKVEVPRGTHIEITIATRLDADAAELNVSKVDLPLSSSQARNFHGSFVARESGPLSIRLHRKHTWFRDRTTRELVTIADAPPQVAIVTPVEGSVVAPEAAIDLQVRASDDAGLATLDLVSAGPDGRQQRRRLWTARGEQSALTVDERSVMLVSDLLAKPGDVVSLWIEAADQSAFEGPNHTRSAVVHIEIASDAGEKLQVRQALRELLDHMVEALAVRLEQPPVADELDSRRRNQRLSDKGRTLIDALDTWLNALPNTDAIKRTDRDALRAMRARHRRLLTEEQVLYGQTLAPLPARSLADRHSVEALEGDTLFLADLLGRAHLSEAEALAAELGQIQKQLSELMKRLESTDDAQARAEMLAAIARARTRLTRLMESLAQLADHVPGEFVNADALQAKSGQNTLSSMEEALQRNDLKAAEEQLAALTRDVDALQQALRDGTLSFTQDRFGERNQALEAARSELAALTQEQQRLAQRSGDRLNQLSERWAKRHGTGSVTPALQAKAKAAREAVAAIDRSTLGSLETQALDRVSQRVSDTTSALGAGDILEAERMASLAADHAQELERDLDIMRRMFPGARGETARNAERAQRATRAIESLQSALQQQAPDVSSEMNGEDQQALRGDVDPQQRTRAGTGSLAETLEGKGGNAPLHQEGAQNLRNAERSMQQAERALRGGDPEAAASAQSDARDALQAAQESMREESSGQRGGRGEQEGNDMGSGHVRIPEQNQSASHALRQKLIEGMRAARPRGYEQATERYYRELLE